jgi:hypothetical protein
MNTLQKSIKVGQKASFAEIQEAYPDQWVKMLDPVFEKGVLIEGVFAGQSDHIDKATKLKVSDSIQYTSITVIYTGELFGENEEFFY